MEKKASGKWSIVLPIILIVIGICIGYQIIKKNEEATEKMIEAQNELVMETKYDLEDQYFPLTGEATAIEIVNTGRLKILYLNGSFLDNHKHGDIYYDYSLKFVSTDKYCLTARKDIPGSSYKEDYYISCMLMKDNEGYVLSDLDTDDPSIEFDTSRMLIGKDKDEMHDREIDFFRESWEYIFKGN